MVKKTGPKTERNAAEEKRRETRRLVLMLWIAQGKPEKTQAGLAAYCGVQPQAVTKWLRTGQISPIHDRKIEEYYDKPRGSFSGLEQSRRTSLEDYESRMLDHLENLSERDRKTLEMVAEAMRRNKGLPRLLRLNPLRGHSKQKPNNEPR